VPSVVELAEVAVTADLRDGTWAVEIPSGRHRVREWTWGERRRLVDSAIRPGPVLDAEAFVEGLVALLVDPVPSAPDRDLLGAVTLRLLGVAPGQQPPSLLGAEAAFARAWGFGPAELDHQPAPRLDQQLALLPPLEPTVAPHRGEWTSIVVDDGD
jgi:hypothetical protein